MNNIYGLIFLNLNQVGSGFVDDFTSTRLADIKFYMFADYLTYNFMIIIVYTHLKQMLVNYFTVYVVQSFTVHIKVHKINKHIQLL